MKVNADLRKIAIRCALLTALCLCGGLLLGLGVGIAVSGLPMHVPERTRNLLSALPVLGIVTAAGAAWGYCMGLASGVSNLRRMAWAGGLSFAPSLFLAALVLLRLEVAIVERGGGPDLPVHLVFTLLFVPAAFFIAGMDSMALGLAQGDTRLAARLALGGALAGGLAFLIVNLVMDALGWRVGAPGAAERATMLTVMMVSNLGAALAGGAVLGMLLGNYAFKETPETAPAAPIEVEAA